MTPPSPAENAKAIASSPRALPRRLTVASGKGGVGKTWFAVTLAQALAFLGEHVLLVDGDLGLANVDVQLGLTPQADLSAVITGQVTLDDAVASYGGGTKAADKGGFDVVPGCSGAGTLAALAAAELHTLALGLVTLEARYARIIVDLGAGIDIAVTTLCTEDRGSAGHAILVVLTDEPTSLTDAYALIKVIRRHAPTADMRIVVNRAKSLHQGKRTYQALVKATATFLGFTPPLVGIVPDDSRVADAVRHQTALLTRHPQSKAGAGVMAAARALQMP